MLMDIVLIIRKMRSKNMKCTGCLPNKCYNQDEIDGAPLLISWLDMSVFLGTFPVFPVPQFASDEEFAWRIHEDEVTLS